MRISDNKTTISSDLGYLLINKNDLSSGNTVYLNNPEDIADWEEITIAEYNKLNAQIKELDRQGKI